MSPEQLLHILCVEVFILSCMLLFRLLIVYCRTCCCLDDIKVEASDDSRDDGAKADLEESGDDLFVGATTKKAKKYTKVVTKAMPKDVIKIKKEVIKPPKTTLKKASESSVIDLTLSEGEDGTPKQVFPVATLFVYAL